MSDKRDTSFRFWLKKITQEVSLRNHHHEEVLKQSGFEAGGRANGLHRRMEMRIWTPAVKTVHSAENLQTRLQKGNCAPGTQLGRKLGRRSWQLLICHFL